MKTLEYKHTISTFNGCKFLIKSLDRTSANAGISTVHIFGDEAKYLQYEKLKKSFPTLRGDSLLYKNSPYFMGQTFLTDMPNPLDREDEWIMRMGDNMRVDRLVSAISTAFVLNDLQWDLYEAKKNNCNDLTIRNIERNIERWTARMLKVRKNLILFHVVSSLVNVDILTFDYLLTQFHTLKYEEFKRAILSIRVALERGARFYGNLSDSHFYEDGYNYEFYDRYGLRDNISQTCEGLKYLQKNKPLEAGFDAGNMMSLVFGQEQGNKYRVLKDMYTLTPDWIRELANQFIQFWKPHGNKILHLYHDRAANQYRKAGKDFATQLKTNIEKDEQGKSTGWHVRLMSIGQGNITHDTEFNLMNVMMSGKEPLLPELLIDKYECRELRSSIMLAPVEKDSKGQIKKVKKSEKLPLERLPLESTNMSDAFKYLMCRSKYINISKSKRNVSFVGSVKEY